MMASLQNEKAEINMHKKVLLFKYETFTSQKTKCIETNYAPRKQGR